MTNATLERPRCHAGDWLAARRRCSRKKRSWNHLREPSCRRTPGVAVGSRRK